MRSDLLFAKYRILLLKNDFTTKDVVDALGIAIAAIDELDKYEDQRRAMLEGNWDENDDQADAGRYISMQIGKLNETGEDAEDQEPLGFNIRYGDAPKDVYSRDQYGGFGEYDGTENDALRLAFVLGIRAGQWMEQTQPNITHISLFHRDIPSLLDPFVAPTFGFKAFVRGKEIPKPARCEYCGGVMERNYKRPMEEGKPVPMKCSLCGKEPSNG